MRHVSVQQLSAFLDGALVGVSRELVTRHLTACAHCRERHEGWRANDDALRRVLAWEPDDRTLEEWSSRVEMTLIAERKGLPPPEFSELHHPVIGNAAPESGRLDIVVQSVRRTRRGAPPPAAEPSPAAPAAEAESVPAEPAESTLEIDAAVAGSAPDEAAAPAPEPAAEAARASEPARDPEPVRAHVQFPPPRPRVLEPAPAAEHFPDPPPPPRQPPTLEVVPGIPALTGRPAPPSRRARPLLYLVSGLLLLVVAGSPLVPEVIRIPLPERWRWRLPRVEFVRRDHPLPTPGVTAPSTQLATSLPEVSVPVPPAPIDVPADTNATRGSVPDPTAAAASDSSGTDAPREESAEPKPAEPKPAVEKASEAKATRPTRAIVSGRTTPPRRAPKKVAPPPAEPEPPVTGVESPGTIIPSTRVTTTVQAVPAPAETTPPPAPAPPAAPARPADSEEDWPLLCGTVQDAAGAPVEGARVVLPANALTVRTDRRGRFCVACPPGTQDLRVEAAGHQDFSRTVELSTGMVEITIPLRRSP